MTTTLEHALFYADHGWCVFPLKEKDKVPTVKWADVATTNRDTIITWWTSTPSANVGIMTGNKSGLLVLDIDAGHGGEETLADLQNKYSELPQTPMCRTGGGGRHFFFKYADGTKNTASKIGVGIDTRSEGGYVVAANSIHPSGKPYEWDKEHLPSKTQISEAPDWLLKMLFTEKTAAPVMTNADGAYISGQRNNAMTSLAGTMRRRGMTEDSIFLAINAENLNRCIPPLPEAEVRMIVSSVMRYDPQAAMPLTNKDRAQAEWGFIKSVFEWPNIANEYMDVKVTDFGQRELGTFWEQVNAGIDVTVAASNSGILAELENAKNYQGGRVEGYAKQIKHFGYHAGILKLAETIKTQAAAGNTTGVAKALNDINKIPSQMENRIISIGDTADEVEAKIKEREKNPTDVWGIPYAWDKISKVTGGKHKGELIIGAGEPGVGKSWYWMQDALITAVDHNRPVKYWCGEMKRYQLMMRFYQILGVDGLKMKTGRMDNDEWQKLAEAKALVMNSPLYIDDRPLHLNEIRQLLIKEIAEFGLEQVVFDYESLITAFGKDEIEQSANISRGLKQLAQELDIALILISSVNKGGMDKEGGYASKSDVRGSGQKIHDADIVYIITKFDNSKGMEYGVKLDDYDKTILLNIKKGRELVGVENGFIPYTRESNSPKFREVIKPERRK